jgi:hypothetical protein
VKIRTCPSLVDPRAGDYCIIVYVIPVGNRQRSLRCGKRPFCRTDAGLQAGVHKSDAKSDAFMDVDDRKLQILLEVWADLPESVKDALLVRVSDRT